MTRIRKILRFMAKIGVAMIIGVVTVLDFYIRDLVSALDAYELDRKGRAINRFLVFLFKVLFTIILIIGWVRLLS